LEWRPAAQVIGQNNTPKEERRIYKTLALASAPWREYYPRHDTGVVTTIISDVAIWPE